MNIDDLFGPHTDERCYRCDSELFEWELESGLCNECWRIEQDSSDEYYEEEEDDETRP